LIDESEDKIDSVHLHVYMFSSLLKSGSTRLFQTTGPYSASGRMNVMCFTIRTLGRNQLVFVDVVLDKIHRKHADKNRV
jgi:hypothetical protein